MVNRIDFLAEAYTNSFMHFPFPVKELLLCVKYEDDMIESFGNMTADSLEVVVDGIENREGRTTSAGGCN